MFSDLDVGADSHVACAADVDDGHEPPVDTRTTPVMAAMGSQTVSSLLLRMDFTGCGIRSSARAIHGVDGGW